MSQSANDEQVVAQKLVDLVKDGRASRQQILSILRKEASEHSFFEACVRTLCAFGCEHKMAAVLSSLKADIRDPKDRAIINSMMLPGQKELSLVA